jgi:hypothetical protein
MRISVFAIFVALATASSSFAVAENPKPDPSLFQVVQGTWAWKDIPESSCETKPYVLTFVENNTKMILKYPTTGAEVVYQVLYAEKNKITMLIEGEKRRTDFDDRVIWVLVLNNPNSYQWRRTDWKPDERTKEIVRCR